MEVKLNQKIRQNFAKNDIFQKQSRDNRILKNCLMHILYFVSGFLLSLGRIAGALHPLPLALISIAKKKGYFSAGAGAIVGYLALGLSEYTVRYIVAVVIACLGAFSLEMLKLDHSPALPMLISSGICFATGIVLAISTYADMHAIMMLIGETVFTLGATYFYFRSINASFKRLRFRALPIYDVTCIIISCSTLLMSSAYIHIGLFNPIRAIGIAAVLFTIRYADENRGMVLACAFGFVFGIYDSNALFICGAISFSAIVAELFKPLSCMALGISYIVCTSFFCIANGETTGFALFIDTIVGLAIFLLMPYRICEKIEKAFDNGKDISPDGALRQDLVLKLRFASSAMSAISDSVDQVREKINEVARRENLRKKEELSEEEYTRNEIILEKTNQIRMVASDQFYSISGMLDDLAQEFDKAERFDSSASAKIRRLLGDYDIYPANISAIEDKYGRMRVEILTDRTTSGLNNPNLRNEIGKICNRYFEPGRITNFKDDTMLSFTEMPCYRLSIGFAQHSAEGELCGDTIKIINDGNGRCILIISDGMGKGSRAALDGAMGAGLLSRLLNAGFGFDSSLKIINSALLVKSNDESLATLDIASIDLFTGKCEIFKAGAPACYIIKNKRINKCELTSMPAGILRGIEFAKRTAVLATEDSIVLLSDGITDLGDEWVMANINEAQGLSPQDFADNLLNRALKASDERRIDDMSIICAKLERNQ